MNDIVKAFLEKVRAQADREVEVMRANGFVIDNLDEPWQKLAFTLYTDIAALSTEAKQILEHLEEEKEHGQDED